MDWRNKHNCTMHIYQGILYTQVGPVQNIKPNQINKART